MDLLSRGLSVQLKHRADDLVGRCVIHADHEEGMSADQAFIRQKVLSCTQGEFLLVRSGVDADFVDTAQTNQDRQVRSEISHRPRIDITASDAILPSKRSDRDPLGSEFHPAGSRPTG